MFDFGRDFDFSSFGSEKSCFEKVQLKLRVLLFSCVGSLLKLDLDVLFIFYVLG